MKQQQQKKKSKKDKAGRPWNTYSRKLSHKEKCKIRYKEVKAAVELKLIKVIQCVGESILIKIIVKLQ